PPVIFVRNNAAFYVGGGPDLSDVCGTIVIPPVFIPTHELQSNRTADKLRHDGSGLRNVVLAAVSVITRPFLITNLNLFSRHSEDAGKTRACSVDILRRGDDQRRIRFHVGNGTVGSERSVGVIRTAANLSHNVRSSGYCTVHISFLEDNPILRL